MKRGTLILGFITAIAAGSACDVAFHDPYYDAPGPAPAPVYYDADGDGPSELVVARARRMLLGNHRGCRSKWLSHAAGRRDSNASFTIAGNN